MTEKERGLNQEQPNKQEAEPCQYDFQIENREWNEKRGTESTWHYGASYRVCKKCGKEEFVLGTIVVPAGKGYPGGEYLMTEDGGIGMPIS